jgi:hypothetical protein
VVWSPDLEMVCLAGLEPEGVRRVCRSMAMRDWQVTEEWRSGLKNLIYASAPEPPAPGTENIVANADRSTICGCKGVARDAALRRLQFPT